jgi:predicted phage tail protein
MIRTDIKRIRGGRVHGAKGSKEPEQHIPVEAPNDLRSVSRGRILDLIAHGPIFGLVDGAKSVYLDGTVLQNKDNSYNFNGVKLTTREGYPDQAMIPGFRAVETPTDVNTALKYDVPIVRAVNNSDANAVLVIVQVNALTRQEDNGDINPHRVQVMVETKNGNQPWVKRVDDIIKGKTTSAYQRTYRVELVGDGPWQVRLSRVSKDETNSKRQSPLFWTGMTEIIDYRLSYSDSAIVGIELDAQLFGNQMPARSYDMKLSIIQVPSNYDPDTRVYTGIWDGNFKMAWTDNPAWCYYDLATHPVIGANLKNVDKWELYRIGRYCDELVPDGYGGMEPRFTLNTLFAERTEAITTLTSLASVFRGMTYWGSNTVVPVADMPRDMKKLVVPANVVEGDFDYSGTSMKERHSVAIVMWNDPDDAFKAKPEVVDDPESVVEFGWRETTVTAFGCSSRGQAHRLGKWILYSERMETQTVTYSATSDHADLRPGDIIGISDPEMAGARLGGRLAGKSESQVQMLLDQAPPQILEGQWFFSVMMPDGTIERQTVIAVSGNSITLQAPLSVTPLDGAIWVLSSLPVQVGLWRVAGVDETGSTGVFKITATEYDPNKFNNVENDLKLPPPQTSMIPSGPLKPPTDISIIEYLYRDVLTVKSGFTVSVTAGDDARIALNEMQVLRPDQEDYERQAPGANSFDVADAAPGQYSIQVRSVSGIGTKSAWLTRTFYVQGLLKPPSDVQDLRITVNGGQIMLTWPPVPDLDLSHYEIRYSPSTENPNWGAALATINQVAAGTTSIMVPARRGVYLIKAVDTSGMESLNAVYAVSTIADLVGVNVVEVVDEGPLWLGTHDNTAGQPAGLQLAPIDNIASWLTMASVERMSYAFQGVHSDGVYTAAEIVDMGDVYTCRLTGDMDVYGYDLLSVIASWTTLADVARMDDSQVGQWAAALEVSYSMTPAPDAPTDWSEWLPLSISEYTARAFRFRILLSTTVPSITPVVRNMGITVDVPDRVAGGADMTCPPEGMRVHFEPSFMVRPSLAVDAQGMQIGDTRRLENINAEGFDLQFFNENMEPISRTFDYLAKGYGYRVTS